MTDLVGVDLEELESQLYSQIYHSFENPQEEPTNEIIDAAKNNCLQKTRYFQPQVPNSRYVWSNEQQQGQSSTPLKTGDPKMLSPLVQHKTPQMLNNPYNVISELPEVQTETAGTPGRNKNLEKYLTRQTAREIKKLKMIEKFKKRRQKKKQLKLELQKQKQQDAEQELLRAEFLKKQREQELPFRVHSMSKVTTISNKSETTTGNVPSDDEIVVIPEKTELIVLSSDDEDIQKREKSDDSICCLDVSISKVGEQPLQKSDDDVIFVEPDPKEIEVIDIDADSITSSLNAIDEKQRSSETNSTSSDILMKIPHVPPRRKLNLTPKDKDRELNTPDSSVSNDFLDNSIDLQSQSNFNFSLHGSDFGTSNNMSKSKVPEMSDTESSCSASDMSTPVKINVFKEIEFETPNKQLFHEEGNLELFDSYITPNRKTTDSCITSNNDASHFEQVLTKASSNFNTSTLHHSSDSSSSESDYGESKVRSLTNFRHLSELSTVDDLATTEKDNFIIVDNSATSQQTQDKNEGKRKTDEADTPNKKQKIEEQYKEERNTEEEITADIVTIDEDSLIVIDDTSSDVDMEIVDSDDTESYFSCDEFNNITADLTLANLSAQSSKSDIDAPNDLPVTLVNSSVEAVQRTMSDDPDLWKILDVDRLRFRFPTPRGPRCHRCREIGHMALHCTSKQGPPACTLCGGRDHVEPRCPKAMCTSCGRLGGHTTYCSYCANWRNVQCRICKLYGHIDSVCPDSWRRYHLTTKPGPIVKPAKTDLKAEKDRWCSGCAQSGHFESSCPYYNRTHFAVYPDVKHYVDLYNFPKTQPFIIYQEEPDPPRPSTSSASRDKIKTLKITVNRSSDRLVDIADYDLDDALNQEDSFHDAESGCSEKTNFEDEYVDNINSYFSCLPTPEFIPPAIRKQMTNVRKIYLQSIKQDAVNNQQLKAARDDLLVASTSGERRPVLLEDFVSLEPDYNLMESNSLKKRIGYTQMLKLDHYQFAYIHSKRGINLLNNIRRYPGIQMAIEKYDEAPAGEMTLNGTSNTVVSNAKQEIVRFLRAMPPIQILPLESREMIEFLQHCKERLDKAEGNCWTLYKKLCRIRNNANKSDLTPQVVKLKSDMQVTIQMLLYGKLKLENGGEHLGRIHEWIRVLRDRSNHQIPLNDIFDLYESYSYLFEPRKTIYPYKNLCAQHDHYILPTVDSSKRRKMPEKNRGFVETKSKFVIDSCKKYNLPNKFLTELMTIQKAMQASQYSRVSYGDFLRFLKRFKAFMKKNKIM